MLNQAVKTEHAERKIEKIDVITIPIWNLILQDIKFAIYQSSGFPEK